DEFQNALNKGGNNYQISVPSTNSQEEEGTMKHVYSVHGMTCSGCQNHVADLLNEVEDVTNVEVDLEKHEAVIEMNKHVPLKTFQKKLEEDGGAYSITLKGDKPDKSQKKDKKDTRGGSGVYYCPMHCEGEKTYDKPGDCPVCGMDLVEAPSATKIAQKYTCPMHPEVIEDEMGSCQICGMDLVPMEAGIEEEEDQTYKKLKRKLWIASIFTIPIFFIAMSQDMFSSNPLLNIMSWQYWNWVQM